MRLSLNDRVVLDTLGDEVLVLDGDNGVVHRLTGPIAGYALSLRDGVGELEDDEYTRALIDAGIAVEVTSTDEKSGGISRRSALGVLVGASAGAATLLLPSAADAVSVGGGSSETTLPAYPDASWAVKINTSYDQGPPDVRSLKLRWGQSYPTQTSVTNPVAFDWTVVGPPGSGISYSGTEPITGFVDFFEVANWAHGQTLTITFVSIPPPGYASVTRVTTAIGP